MQVKPFHSCMQLLPVKSVTFGYIKLYNYALSYLVVTDVKMAVLVFYKFAYKNIYRHACMCMYMFM